MINMRGGLFLRKVVPVQAKDKYRVILKSEDGEFEIGSIGVQYHAGPGGLDLGHRYRHPDARDRRRGPRQRPRRLQEAAWIRFASDEARLTEFLVAKRKRG
jgi:hypothetical protein